MNLAILIGRLGNTPETRVTAKGTPQTSFTLVTNEIKKSSSGYEEVPEFHRCVCFGKLAESVAKHVVKGQLVSLEGRIKTRQYTSKDGEKRSITEIIVEKVEFHNKPQNKEQHYQPQIDESSIDDFIE